MFKLICGVLWFIFVSVAVFGSGTTVGDAAMEWLVGIFVYALIALVILEFINFILSIFQ